MGRPNNIQGLMFRQYEDDNWEYWFPVPEQFVLDTYRESGFEFKKVSVPPLVHEFIVWQQARYDDLQEELSYMEDQCESRYRGTSRFKG